MTQTQAIDLKHIHKSQALSDHEKNIEFYAKGMRRGAAELYGYSALAGREMLLAKDLVVHGNKDPEAGFKNWIAERFPWIAYCTATRWMRFYEAIRDKGCTAQLFTAAPKLLGNGELSEKDCEVVLDIVPQLMDGKSATTFMRDLKLAKEPTPAGGYRPDLKALRKWLEANHPDLVETPWASLPVAVRQDFKKEHKPKIDPKLVAESKRQKAEHIRDDLNQMLTDQEFKKYWSPELRAEFKDLFWDFHRSLTALDKTKPKAAK